VSGSGGPKTPASKTIKSASTSRQTHKSEREPLRNTGESKPEKPKPAHRDGPLGKREERTNDANKNKIIMSRAVETNRENATVQHNGKMRFAAIRSDRVSSRAVCSHRIYFGRVHGAARTPHWPFKPVAGGGSTPD